MEKFHEILLDVWREACRHIEIGESTATIAQLLEDRMPLSQVIIRRFEQAACVVETVAVGLASSGGSSADVRTPFPRALGGVIAAWCTGGDVLHREEQGAAEHLLDVIVPSDTEGDVLVGPLKTQGGLLGAAILVSEPQQTFEAKHVGMMEVLLEPFSVALDNDRRLREMASLREAAEADKRSLLIRLGREDLGDTIVGADTGLRSVMERVELVARSDVPVLILGETGTGKELIARVIHRRSPRAAGPVIRVNCGAIPPELLDSQLFGHERGAFTGAVETRKGWFERADGGTLFLDEIGELPLAAQVRLLRILQDGWLERIGAHQAIKVDVRVVASTHRDLAAMVAEGRFREDFWYRIAVFPILLPPLRDRVGDIPLLARHFAEKAAVRFGLPVLMPTDEDIALLASYAWPGNVRELGTVLDRAAIIGDGRRLEVAKALGVMGPGAEAPATSRADTAAQEGVAQRPLSLDEAMRRHIQAALTRTRGRIEGPQGAAALLQINPHTLRARMRKLGIDWAAYRMRDPRSDHPGNQESSRG